jgi:pimeloyl-ACP methyl ester carboxylesterase
VLTQGPSTIADWNNDFASLTTAAKSLLVKNFGKGPGRTYAVGLSNGGGQVRSLLEQHPDLVDGGVDWSGVYWSQQANFLFYMPKFLAAMPAYISSGFTDAHAIATIKALGYPADRLQPGSAHSSLWSDYYSTAIPYYSDLTVFAYARWLDSSTNSGFTGSVPCTPNAVNPIALPGTCTATGLALPAGRAAYQPSAQAQSVFGSFAHTGLIGKPLVSIAGTADMFITPENNALRYLAAVKAAGRGQLYHLYLVNGGTHVDTFAAFGYGLQPQLPFAWRAFDELVDIVEHNANPPGAGASATVNTPNDIPVP